MGRDLITNSDWSQNSKSHILALSQEFDIGITIMLESAESRDELD
jgi:hypothetical protein